MYFVEQSLQNKSIDVIVLARAFQCPCTAEPLRGTGIRNKVIDSSEWGRSLHLDGHPERAICSGCCAEDLALVIVDLPVTAITSFKERSREVHR